MTAGTTTADQRRTFHTLDGLRGVAALAVVFRHIPENAIGNWTPESYLAVDLFFLLSGFVLAHAYEARLARGMTIVDFCAARLIRLYPLYILASLITLLIVFVPAMPGHYHPPGRSLRTIVLALLFVPTIDPSQPDTALFPLVGPAWSLFAELVVNLVFAAIVTRLDRWRLALLLVAGEAMLIATALYFQSIDVGYTQTNILGGFGRVSFAFFAGVAVNRLWKADALPWLRLPAWAAVAAVALTFHCVPDGHETLYDVAMIMVAFPALVLASARSQPGRWLARPFALLGGASYGIYVLQNPIDQWFETLVPWALVPTYSGTGTLGALAVAAAIVAVALVCDRTYDLPLRRALTRRWRNRTIATGDRPAPASRGVSGR
nr:acyltransferase [Polymorphobacter sp.]